MRKWLVRGFLVLVVLVCAAFGLLSYGMGSARDAYGFLRFAVLRMGEGEVTVGDKAPDVELMSADGTSRLRLHDRIGARPLVLIFGSYT